MRLLNYPILVQEEIFSNMEYETIFPLSLTSRNILRILKQTRWRSIEVTFVFDWNKFQIYFGDSTIPLELIPKKFISYEIFPHIFAYLEGSHYETKHVYKFETKSGSWKTIVIRMYEHILELFQKSPSLRFGARFSIPDVRCYIPIASLNVATFSDVSADNLTTFMRNHLDLKLLVLEENPFFEIPGTINIRNLQVLYFKKNFLYYISHYKGVNAYFCGPTEANHIHEFVDGWLNKKYSENVNLIHIEQENSGRFRPELLENYRQNQWDLNRMPLEYELDERDKYYTQFPGPFKMDNAVYVQRESDGKILSLQNTSRIFIGCVWNHEDVFRE